MPGRIFMCLLSGFQSCAVRLRQTGTVKALGNDAALRIAEIESGCVGPNGQPTDQIGRSFHDDRLPRRRGKIESELAGNETGVEKFRWRVSFADCVKVKIGHVNVAGAVHGHAVGIAKPRGSAYSISRAVE